MIMMKRVRLPIIVGTVLIVTLLLMLFFEPLFLRKNYITRLVDFDIPQSAQIIEYKFGISSYGIDPFYAKLKITREDYYILKRYFSNEQALREINHIQQNFNHLSLNLEDAKEIGLRDVMTSKYSFFLVGSTRVIYVILIKDNDGGHYLHVFY